MLQSNLAGLFELQTMTVDESTIFSPYFLCLVLLDIFHIPQFLMPVGISAICVDLIW